MPGVLHVETYYGTYTRRLDGGEGNVSCGDSLVTKYRKWSLYNGYRVILNIVECNIGVWLWSIDLRLVGFGVDVVG